VNAQLWNDDSHLPHAGFYQVTFKSSGGRRSIWAKLLKKDGGRYVYQEVNRDGGWGNDGKMRITIATDEDIIHENPARMNKRYGELETQPRLTPPSTRLSRRAGGAGRWGGKGASV